MASSTQQRRLTVLSIAVIDVTVSERAPGAQVPTDPDRHHLTHLVKEVVELRVVHILIKISNVQGRRHELACTVGDHAVCNYRRLRLHLHLGHYVNPPKNLFLHFFFSKFFSSKSGIFFLCLVW